MRVWTDKHSKMRYTGTETVWQNTHMCSITRLVMNHALRNTITCGIACTGLLIGNTTHAGNISPQSMGDWNGKGYTQSSSIQQGYDIVVRQLGLAIANKPQTVTSMGIHGFEMSVQNSVSFIDAARYSDGSPSPWNLAFSDEEAKILDSSLHPFLFLL